MRRCTLRGLSAIGLAAVTAACAGLAPAPAFKPWTNFYDHPKGYLAPGAAPRAEAILPGPPAKGSPREAVDVAAYRATRRLEGTSRWTLAARDADIDTPRSPDALACALGVEIDPARAPTLATLLGRVMSDVDASLRGAKTVFARPRPFVTQDAPICVAREEWLVKSGSYPSGHAATGWTWSLILGELAPDRADALHRRALAYGDSRVVCGVHYLSDVEAGRVVGAAVTARLHTDPGFRADFARAGRELAALRAASGTVIARCPAETEALSKPAF